MSAIDDIIQGLDTVIEQVGETSTAAASVMQATEEALGQAEALGANAAVEGLAAVKEQLEALVAQIGAVTTSAEEVQATARAVADSA